MRNGTQLAEYTQPYIESGLVIVAPVKHVTSSAWAFLEPFTLEMWCVTVALFILVGIVVWLLEHRTNEEFRGSPRRQVITMLWYVCCMFQLCGYFSILIYHALFESKFWLAIPIMGEKCF